jgi:hypothetical protein
MAIKHLLKPILKGACTNQLLARRGSIVSSANPRLALCRAVLQHLCKHRPLLPKPTGTFPTTPIYMTLHRLFSPNMG